MLIATAAGAAGALITALGRLAVRMIAGERRKMIVEYQIQVIEQLQQENATLRKRIGQLEERIVHLESERDDPPPHLG